MKATACVWCSQLIKVDDTYNDLQHIGVCSQGCRDAEYIFGIHWSDEAINRRAHYRDLTEGTDNDEA